MLFCSSLLQHTVQILLVDKAFYWLIAGLYTPFVMCLSAQSKPADRLTVCLTELTRVCGDHRCENAQHSAAAARHHRCGSPLQPQDAHPRRTHRRDCQSSKHAACGLMNAPAFCNSQYLPSCCNPFALQQDRCCCTPRCPLNSESGGD